MYRQSVTGLGPEIWLSVAWPLLDKCNVQIVFIWPQPLDFYFLCM